MKTFESYLETLLFSIKDIGVKATHENSLVTRLEQFGFGNGVR